MKKQGLPKSTSRSTRVPVTRAQRDASGYTARGVNDDLTAALVEDIHRRALLRASMLSQLERMITLADRILRMSQPPKPGKIGVRWWIPRGGRSSLNTGSTKLGGRSLIKVYDPSRLRRPYLVQWLPVKRGRGRWRAEPLAQVRATLIHRDRSSKVNFDVTVAVARLAADLIKVYTYHLNRFLEWRGPAIDEAGFLMRQDETLAKLASLHSDAVANLLNAGYAVDPATRGLLELWEDGQDILPDDAVDEADQPSPAPDVPLGADSDEGDEGDEAVEPEPLPWA